MTKMDKNSVMSAVVNAATRRIEAMFPGYFSSAKHNHYADYSWPTEVTFQQLYSMYTRNSLAAAGVDTTVGKTWETDPEIWETKEAAESELESQIRQLFEDLHVWQSFAEADARSMVGGYAGAILRLRDGKKLDQPVEGYISGGLEALVEIVPAWAGQLEVSEWDLDETSEDYGKPKMYQFNESAIGNTTNATVAAPRQFAVHPDRVIIFSKDRTTNCTSDLLPGYNDLIDAEKVKGAGGEGFWKNARGSQVLSSKDGNMDLRRMAKSMGLADETELLEAINDQVEDFQKGFDKMLLLSNLEAKGLEVSLPSPEHFFNNPVNCFAASLRIPVKILLGSQTGERASTEDANEWAKTINARRSKRLKPIIKDFLNRLERFGMIPQKDYTIQWTDLTEASRAEKISRAETMSKINTSQIQSMGQPVWSSEEIRAASGDEGPTPSEMDFEPPTTPDPTADPGSTQDPNQPDKGAPGQ